MVYWILVQLEREAAEVSIVVSSSAPVISYPARGILLRVQRNHEFQAPVWEKASFVRYKVWGLTARILVETARIAYGRNPQFSFAKNIGDEQLIRSMFNGGKQAEENRSGESAVQKALPGKRLENL
jgi:hypothetical protein